MTVANFVGTIEERVVQIRADLTAEEAIEVREPTASIAIASAAKERPKADPITTLLRSIVAKEWC